MFCFVMYHRYLMKGNLEGPFLETAFSICNVHRMYKGLWRRKKRFYWRPLFITFSVVSCFNLYNVSKDGSIPKDDIVCQKADLNVSLKLLLQETAIINLF